MSLSPANPSKRRVLAIASRGGHWIQLLRLKDAFSAAEVTFVTTVADYRSSVAGHDFRVVVEATRKSKVKLAVLALQILWILVRVRPHVVVTTGAAPGFFAIRLGRLLGAKTLWIDSIANAEELSLSGRMAAKHAHVTLTQWEHLADDASVQYRGAVI